MKKSVDRLLARVIWGKTVRRDGWETRKPSAVRRCRTSRKTRLRSVVEKESSEYSLPAQRYNFFVPPNHGSDHIDTLLFFLDRLGKKLVENGFFYILYTADDRKEYQ